MENQWDELENYRKNLRCIQEVTEELLSHMKGHGWSFRSEITDKKGAFSREKLRALVEELLSLWEARLAENTDIDPETGKSVAEPYLQERRELYGLYLYLVMRCSLCQGGYANARGRELEETADFAFVLEQAKQLSRSWCVTAERDGSRKNQPVYGFDEHFGFHLYSPINHYLTFREVDVRLLGDDFALTPDWKMVRTDSDSLTNEGNMKRFFFQHRSGLSPSRLEEDEPEERDEPEEPKETDEEDCDGPSVYDAEEDVDEPDFWSPLDEETCAAFREAKAERMGELERRNWELLLLIRSFEDLNEYCSACERFKSLFETARPYILRDFHRELEEISDLYLAMKGIAPLTDTDKALNVYSRIYDGPYRQAKRYGRGLKWDSL